MMKLQFDDEGQLTPEYLEYFKDTCLNELLAQILTELGRSHKRIRQLELEQIFTKAEQAKMQ
jgi:hypothetical protein